MDTSTLLSIAAIAVSGVTLLWTVGWSVYTHRRATQATLVVRNAFVIPVFDHGMGRRGAINVTATNVGAVNLTLNGVQLRIKGKKETVAPVEWVGQTPQPLPLILEPGQHWTGLLDAGSIVASLEHQYGVREEWRVQASVRDTADRTFAASEWATIYLANLALLERG